MPEHTVTVNTRFNAGDRVRMIGCTTDPYHCQILGVSYDKSNDQMTYGVRWADTGMISRSPVGHMDQQYLLVPPEPTVVEERDVCVVMGRIACVPPQLRGDRPVGKLKLWSDNTVTYEAVDQ